MRRVSTENLLSYFPKDFPKGWCGLASRVLGGVLCKEYPQTEIYYTWGYIDGQSHAWVQFDEYILDITADQFNGITSEIIIEKNDQSVFHNSFSEVTKRRSSIKDISYYEEKLVYKLIEY